MWYLMVALICGAVAAVIAHAKHRDTVSFFFLGLVGGVFGVAWASLAHKRTPTP
jgi:uncharacterized membrane protein YeaQ/YmgE (transglycosylase-associated protein family)